MGLALHGPHGVLAHGVAEYVVEHDAAREGRVDTATEEAADGKRSEAFFEDVFVDASQAGCPVPAGVVFADGVCVEHRQQLHRL
ncbi:MAG: hypothetical protein ACTIA5_12780 [Brachybacterium tyrofermentans]